MSEIVEFIIEFVIELIVDGTNEISQNKKISKWIRYPLISLCGLIGIFFIGIFIFIGTSVYQDNIWGGLLIYGISLFFLICMIREVRKVYKSKKTKSSEQNKTQENKNTDDHTPPSSDFFYYD